MKKILLVGVIILSCSFVHAQLLKVEKKITSLIEANNPEALKLLEEVVNINSGSMNFDGVYKVGQIFKARLDNLGFKTQWIEGKPFGRSGHLVGYHTGNGAGKTLLLIGHLDTVFEPSNSFQKYTFINDSTVTGPGVADMKGGDVIIIYALEALKQSGVLKDMNIIVVMTGDEELCGHPVELARKELIEAAKAADISIGFEPAKGDSKTAVSARRGSTGWELKVKGVASHSSQIFTDRVGAGAIYEASRILTEFYEKLSVEKDLTFNPGIILGGSEVKRDEKMSGGAAYGKNNIVAKETVVTGDLRAVSHEQLTKAENMMQEIVTHHLPQTEATLTFDETYPPLASTENNRLLLEQFNKVSEDLSLGKVVAVNPRDAGAADISFTAAFVDMAIDGLGLSGGNAHTDKEFANLKWLPRQTKRAAILLYRLTQHPINTKR